MWLIILSDQLPVLALVSRYLTNKLIGREPILERHFKLQPSHHAVKGHNSVLIRLSAGYPELEGRLLTCYAPVRHYPRVRRLASRSTCMS